MARLAIPSMWRQLPPLAAVWYLVALAGCGDKEMVPGHHDEPSYLPRTSASNMLHNLRQAIADRNLTEYDSLLAEDFNFILSVEDQQKPDMPDSLPVPGGRESEMRTVSRMFDPEMVQALTLDFVAGQVHWDLPHGLYALLVSDVDLYFLGSVPGHPGGPEEIHATDGRARFLFRKNGWLWPGTQDSVWTIVLWEDSPADAESWGTLHAAFGDWPFLPRTSPANLLYNLRQAYLDRDAAQYESLLARDFVFILSEEDQAKPDMPHQWYAGTENAIHQRMFDTEMVQNLSVNFVVGDPIWDAEEGKYSVVIQNVNLFLYGATPGHPTEPREYRVSDNRSKFWFRKNHWFAPGTRDSVWTVVKWEDNLIARDAEGHPTVGQEQSWGAIKAMFR